MDKGRLFLQLMEDWKMVICFLTIDDSWEEQG